MKNRFNTLLFYQIVKNYLFLKRWKKISQKISYCRRRQNLSQNSFLSLNVIFWSLFRQIFHRFSLSRQIRIFNQKIFHKYFVNCQKIFRKFLVDRHVDFRRYYFRFNVYIVCRFDVYIKSIDFTTICEIDKKKWND